MGADSGLAACVLAQLQSLLEQLVEQLLGGTAFLRGLVSSLDLPLDLGFSQHERIERANDAEQAADSGTRLAGVHGRLEGFHVLWGKLLVVPYEFGELFDALIRRFGHRVQFGAVAGGKDDRFGQVIRR